MARVVAARVAVSARAVAEVKMRAAEVGGQPPYRRRGDRGEALLLRDCTRRTPHSRARCTTPSSRRSCFHRTGDRLKPLALLVHHIQCRPRSRSRCTAPSSRRSCFHRRGGRPTAVALHCTRSRPHNRARCIARPTRLSLYHKRICTAQPARQAAQNALNFAKGTEGRHTLSSPRSHSSCTAPPMCNPACCRRKAGRGP